MARVNPNDDNELFVTETEPQPLASSVIPDRGFIDLTDQEFFNLLEDFARRDGDAAAAEQQVEEAPSANTATSQNEGETTGSHTNGIDDQDPSSSSSGQIVSSSSSSSGDNETPAMNLDNNTGDQTSLSEWPEEELNAIALDDSLKSKFGDIDGWFRNIKNPSMTDIMPAGQETGPSQEGVQKAPRRKNKTNKVSSNETRRSMDFGLRVLLGHETKKGLSKKSRKRKLGASGGAEYQGPGDKSKGDQMSAKEYIEFLLSSTVISDAHNSASLQEIPLLKGYDKQKALTELVASIPAEGLETARSDKKKVLEATRMFSRRVRSDGKLGWKLKGLKTSLFHFQLLGAAFMRRRETVTQPPFGGLFCDIMGFGKTITSLVLANILDGKPFDPDDPVKTTLIVVPSQLVTHWKEQITKHCEPGEIGDVLVYRANTRLETLDPVKSLEKYDVIITTYDEVRRSYPRFKSPVDLVDEKKIIEWWHDIYLEEVGPLHQIKFHRIIIDEGQFIKNHISSVSIAVRALTGHFKWILSGTPVHNYLEEFYPHFEFIGVPRLGNFDRFAKDYCKTDEAHQRLVNLLRTFLFRRTHQSRLFSLPVIKLPDVDERIVKVNFCEVEREIYNAIQDLYIENINGKAHLDQPKLAQYRCFLAMILMLRMFCSHILTTQIVRWLVSVRKNTTILAKENQNGNPDQFIGELRGDSAKLTELFYNHMSQLHEDEQWEERLLRGNCPKCNFMPVGAVLTSCLHLYCEECYYLLENSGTGASTEWKPICNACQVVIEEAACFDYDRDMELRNNELQSEEQPQWQQRKKKEPKKKKKKDTKKKKISRLHQIGAPQTDEEDDKPDNDEQTDWIAACAEHMPSAKLVKIREIIENWIIVDPSVKVVIFTQFLDFVRILCTMCRKQGWSFRCLTGKMTLGAREDSMREFNDKGGNVRVMIASLKAGGIGLDMSAANKCILVDLWWNEAIQEQAFCRLFRIGQANKVEFVKILVNNSIDEYLHRLQTTKTAEITSIMGEDVLKDRDTVEDLLKMFGHVETDERGAWHLTSKSGGDKKEIFEGVQI
ncbi:hypothetical protein BO71DRAFT_447895 [Aspergillus ellipticus CBS 707.79]|uniref:SNF2 family helicase n=1 Tax=Aspergillus ellipticus CBS 707.79 TaxID=1448320 RepID=A0A319DJ08_9EURO|nr:hypothetical protein BO71DRAFT_447895 [Aspergillus ellipticus CBS 707.79]